MSLVFWQNSNDTELPTFSTESGVKRTSRFRLVPVSHVVFGSDYPHAGEPTLLATLTGIDGLGLTLQDVFSILRVRRGRMGMRSA